MKTATRFVELALTYRGTPYLWGGQSRFGCDCSGLCVACLRTLGILGPTEDLTSRGLFARWPKADKPAAGDLVYFAARSSDTITHVGIVVEPARDPLILEAGLGGSKDTWTPGGSETWSAFVARQTKAGKIVTIRPLSEILARGKKLMGYNRPAWEVQG